jgi:peptide chain release factor 2
MVMADLVESSSEISELQNEVSSIESMVEELTYYTLFDGKYDNANAIVTIRAGAGGTDAQDWVQMLLRMYAQWGAAKDYSIDIVEQTAGTEAGLKSVTVKIAGLRAYGQLRCEVGVHRLVRLSPFNSDNLRQTSFAQVETMPIIDAMPEVEIHDDDLKIDTFRSSGAGGQSVNTTDSAVRITHIPSGIVVSCQNERSQLQNRLQAMTVITAKLHQKYLDEQEEQARELRGEQKKNEWGSQIRSYVLHPYKLVKDHRTKYETPQTDDTLNGKIDPFIEAFLRHNSRR